MKFFGRKFRIGSRQKGKHMWIVNIDTLNLIY